MWWWFIVILSMSGSHRSNFTVTGGKMFIFNLWMQSIDWNVKVKSGKSVMTHYRKMQAVTTLCRFQFGVVKVRALPSDVALVGCLLSSLCWSSRFDLEWGLSSSLLFLLLLRVVLGTCWCTLKSVVSYRADMYVLYDAVGLAGWRLDKTPSR